ncbi:MAG: hypothetical protein ACRD1K_11720 [Acidimicrobiales bacterium]
MTGPDWVRREALRGAAAGVAGGLAFGAAMSQIGVLPTVASIVRADSPAVGFAVHMAIAMIIGAGFGLFVAHQRPGAGETLYWGLTYGAFWWYLGPLTVLPLLLAKPVSWDLEAAQAQVPSLIGHLVYGATTALALVALRRGPASAAVTPGLALRGTVAGVATAGLLAAALDARFEPTASMPMLAGRGHGPAMLAVGALVGLGYALLSPAQGEGAGPALVRGSAYGFAGWVLVGLTLAPLVDGAGLDWSLAAVRAALTTFPGYLLLGAGTGVAFGWLNGLVRALFVDDVRRTHEEGAGARGLRAGGRGALAGLAGGLLFTLVMLQIGFLPTVARLVGANSARAGLVVHLLISQVIGVSYGLLFRRRSYDLASALGWGVSYGFFWWVLGALTLLPVLLGGSPRWSALDLAATFPSLIGHLAYGAGLGVSYHRLEIRTSPWWITRNEAEAARLTLEREQALTSAPALWALVVLIALTVPVLVAG